MIMNAKYAPFVQIFKETVQQQQQQQKMPQDGW